MTVFKKVLKNLLIAFGILLGIFLICLAIMYFANVSLFGLKFKKEPPSTSATVVQSFDVSGYTAVTINTGHVNLDVVKVTDTSSFNFALTDDANGLCKKNHCTLSFKTRTEVSAANKHLIIDIIEPQGWIFWKDTWGTLSLSESMLNNENFKLIINSTKGDAYLSADDTNTQVINDVRFISTKGNLTSQNKIKNLYAETIKGDVTLNNTVIENVEFRTNKGELKFKTIQGDLTVNAGSPYIYGENVDNKFVYNAKSGKIEVERIGRKTVEDSNDPDKGQITDDGYSSDYVLAIGECHIETESAKIIINDLYAKTKISTTKGDVEIKNFANQLYYDNLIYTTKGDIEIENIYSMYLKLQTSKGKIEANVCGDSGELVAVNITGKIDIVAKAEYAMQKVRQAGSETYKDRYIANEYFGGTIKTNNEKGLTKISEVKCIVDADSSKNGKIDVNFLAVNGTSKINSLKGKVTINVPVNSTYSINALSLKSKVDIDLDVLNIDEKTKDYTEKIYNIGGGSNSNLIQIRTNKANIKIRAI